VGLGVDVYRDENTVHALALKVRGIQYLSDKGAGYNGTITQGRGFTVGPQLSYTFSFAEYLELGANAGFGYGQINYWATPTVLAQQSGIQPLLGVWFGGHIPY
jgi:hypothetical protein